MLDTFSFTMTAYGGNMGYAHICSMINNVQKKKHLQLYMLIKIKNEKKV